MCLFAGTVFASDSATVRVLDETNATTGWKTLTDRLGTCELFLAGGPARGSKSLQLDFEFKDSKWIALKKEMKFVLGADDGIRFRYDGSGAVVNLLVKIFDADGNAAGYFVPGGSSTSGWCEVVAPQSEFEFLWGTNPKKVIDWNRLEKFEFTLDTAERSGMTFNMNSGSPGKIAFSKIEVINMTAIKYAAGNASIGAGEISQARKLKSGAFLIDNLRTSEGWYAANDQDGKSVICAIRERVGRGSVHALKMQYDYGAKGVWTALIKSAKLDLSDMQTITFYYRREGATSRLSFKLTDANRSVYGYTVVADVGRRWRRIVIKRDALKFLYSNTTPGELDFSDIRKIEWTLEKTGSENQTGTVYLGGLTYR